MDSVGNNLLRALSDKQSEAFRYRTNGDRLTNCSLSSALVLISVAVSLLAVAASAVASALFCRETRTTAFSTRTTLSSFRTAFAYAKARSAYKTWDEMGKGNSCNRRSEICVLLGQQSPRSQIDLSCSTVRGFLVAVRGTELCNSERAQYSPQYPPFIAGAACNRRHPWKSSSLLAGASSRCGVTCLN